jgi:hypothetical protein
MVNIPSSPSEVNKSPESQPSPVSPEDELRLVQEAVAWCKEHRRLYPDRPNPIEVCTDVKCQKHRRTRVHHKYDLLPDVNCRKLICNEHGLYFWVISRKKGTNECAMTISQNC